jgi:hypothetical protein
MYDFVYDAEDTPEARAELLARLGRMGDEELLKTGKTLAFLARPGAHTKMWGINLQECRAEWRRRHPREG